jgi:molybdopterin converting factor subunit 1
MMVRVKLFAVARQLAGGDAVEIEMSEPATIGRLREALAAQVPELAGIARHVMFAVGTEYASDDAAIDQSAEIACIPPVSGG